jgi:hypothetical protein
MDTLAAAHDAAVQMIDTSIVRVHQHGACIANNRGQHMGRSRGGLTSKIHVVVDGNGLPVELGLTAGQAHDYLWAPTKGLFGQVTQPRLRFQRELAARSSTSPNSSGNSIEGAVH